MVKLTAELIQLAAQYINPVRDREINLRGYKIPVIENLGATLDQFDTVDLCDNDIRKLDGFPLLKRLKNIVICNNRICRVGEHLEESLPYLESLVMTNNHIQELGDLDNLATIKTLQMLSLLRNPVTNKRHYRLYVIHKVPQVRLLDFQKVRMKEREAAAKLFKGRKGKQLEREIGKRSKTFVPGAVIVSSSTAEKSSGPTPSDVEAIKAAIKKASSLEEIEHLKQLLKSGQIPGKDSKSSKGSKTSEVQEEEEEEMETEEVNGK